MIKHTSPSIDFWVGWWLEADGYLSYCVRMMERRWNHKSDDESSCFFFFFLPLFLFLMMLLLLLPLMVINSSINYYYYIYLPQNPFGGIRFPDIPPPGPPPGPPWEKWWWPVTWQAVGWQECQEVDGGAPTEATEPISASDPVFPSSCIFIWLA